MNLQELAAKIGNEYSNRDLEVEFTLKCTVEDLKRKWAWNIEEATAKITGKETVEFSGLTWSEMMFQIGMLDIDNINLKKK